MHLLIDADLIQYRAAFACQKARWKASAKGVVLFEADSHRELLALIKKAGGNPDEMELEKEIDLKPVEVVHQVIRGILSRIVEKTGADSWTLFLSDSRCHRHDIATTKPYKGGRSSKPIHYLEAKRFLLQEYGAEVVDDGEADDAMAICQIEALGKGDTTCIVSYDKDLKQIPGWHFDFIKEVWDRVDYLDGQRLLFKQILIGDPTDNYGGLPRVGEKSKFVKEVYSAGDVEEMRRIVVDAYKQFGEDGKIEEWEDYLWEQANLAYILTGKDTMLNTDLVEVSSDMKDFDHNQEREIPSEPKERLPVPTSEKSEVNVPVTGFRATSRLSH